MNARAVLAILIGVMVLFSSCAIGLVAVHKKFPYLCLLRNCRVLERQLAWRSVKRAITKTIKKKKKHKDSETAFNNNKKLSKMDTNGDVPMRDSSSAFKKNMFLDSNKYVIADSVDAPLINDSISRISNAISDTVFSLVSKQNKLIKSSAADVILGDTAVALSLPDQKKLIIYFPFDEDSITQDDRTRINAYLESMDFEKINTLTVIGYTDNEGNVNYNKSLSMRRVKRVYNYLITSGVPRSKLSFQGLGESAPRASNNTAEGRKRNRCVELHVVFNTP